MSRQWITISVPTPKVVERITSVNVKKRTIGVRYEDGTTERLAVPALAQHDAGVTPLTARPNKTARVGGATGFTLKVWAESASSTPAPRPWTLDASTPVEARPRRGRDPIATKPDTTLTPLPADHLRIDLLRPGFLVQANTGPEKGWNVRDAATNELLIVMGPNGWRVQYGAGASGAMVRAPAQCSYVVSRDGKPVARVDATHFDQAYQLAEVHYGDGSVAVVPLDPAQPRIVRQEAPVPVLAEYGPLPTDWLRIRSDTLAVRRVDDHFMLAQAEKPDAVVVSRLSRDGWRPTYAAGYRTGSERPAHAPTRNYYITPAHDQSPLLAEIEGREREFVVETARIVPLYLPSEAWEYPVAWASTTGGGPEVTVHIAATPTTHTTDVRDLRPWPIVEAVLPNTPRVLLYGPPGTGKTHAAASAGLREQQKVYTVTLTDETPMTELRGHFVMVDHKFVWQDGIAVQAWREGARLVLNEIDHAGGDVQSFLHVVLDDPQLAQLALPTGEVVRPAPGFQVVATMNGAPDDLPTALRDRFPVAIEVNEVHPKALARLANDLREAAKNTTLTDDVERRTSIRVWQEYDTLRAAVGDQLAARACFGHRAQEVLDGLKIAATRTR